jgi:hypothetical protein
MVLVVDPKTEKVITTITTKEYKGLLRDRNMLLALEEAGVDNWVGYDDAMQYYYGDLDEEDL